MPCHTPPSNAMPRDLRQENPDSNGEARCYRRSGTAFHGDFHSSLPRASAALQGWIKLNRGQASPQPRFPKRVPHYTLQPVIDCPRRPELPPSPTWTGNPLGGSSRQPPRACCSEAPSHRTMASATAKTSDATTTGPCISPVLPCPTSASSTCPQICVRRRHFHDVGMLCRQTRKK